MVALFKTAEKTKRHVFGRYGRRFAFEVIVFKNNDVATFMKT